MCMIEFAKTLPNLFQAYGSPVPIKKIVLGETAIAELKLISKHLPDVDWSDPNLPSNVINALRQEQLEDTSELAELLNEACRAYRENGVCVISLGDQVSNLDEDDLKKRLVYLLSALGQPFGAFQKKGFWQTLGVNHQASELRAESAGYIPLHIDFDQSTNPPDGVALFCLRPDPLGGGESIVFDYQKFLSLLDDAQRQQLAEIEYSYATLYGQNGIGELYNPHPLIDLKEHEPDFFRYNGKALSDLKGQFADLFIALEREFKASSSTCPLQGGDMIIVDQNVTLHGREPLCARDEKQSFEASKDRFLWQTYLRHNL